MTSMDFLLYFRQCRIVFKGVTRTMEKHRHTLILYGIWGTAKIISGSRGDAHRSSRITQQKG